MAWIYLAESVDYPLPLNHGLDPFPIVRVTDTAKASCCPECGRVTLRTPQSGMMCERCIGKHFRNESTLSMEDFLVRISPAPVLEQAWKESEADFSLNSSDALATFDQDSFSWKTCQLSLFEDLSGFSWNSLRWGMIRAGRLYQPPNLEPVTKEIDGSSLPTPTAKEGGTNKSKSPNATIRPQLSTLAKTLPTPVARDYRGAGGKNRNSPDLPSTVGGSLNPQFVEEIMGYEIGWTESADWAIQWFQSKREKRSCG